MWTYHIGIKKVFSSQTVWFLYDEHEYSIQLQRYTPLHLNLGFMVLNAWCIFSIIIKIRTALPIFCWVLIISVEWHEWWISELPGEVPYLYLIHVIQTRRIFLRLYFHFLRFRPFLLILLNIIIFMFHFIFIFACLIIIDWFYV